MRQPDRPLAGVELRQPLREDFGGLPAGIQADVLFERRKMDEVLPFPEGGHLPADLLLRLRDGRSDGLPNGSQPGLNGFRLLADVFVDRLRLDAEMVLIFPRQFFPAFRTSPHILSPHDPDMSGLMPLYSELSRWSIP